MSVKIERAGAVFTVIIDRPEARNAVDRDTADALAAAFREFDADDGARAAVLWGAGANFSAGADLKAVAAGQPNRIEDEGDGPLGPTRMRLSKPVIAAVAGYAVAGGLELACWCDLRVTERGATFGVFCRRWGVPLIDGGTIRLPRLIGLSRAMDMILTGRPVKAEEALTFGLANYLVDDGRSRPEAEALADRLAHLPQTCMRNDRLSALEQYDLEWEEAVCNEFRRGRQSLGSPEIVDGVRRYQGGEGRHGESK